MKDVCSGEKRNGLTREAVKKRASDRMHECVQRARRTEAAAKAIQSVIH